MIKTKHLKRDIANELHTAILRGKTRTMKPGRWAVHLRKKMAEVIKCLRKGDTMQDIVNRHQMDKAKKDYSKTTNGIQALNAHWNRFITRSAPASKKSQYERRGMFFVY